jgi:hypothetical protein
MRLQQRAAARHEREELLAAFRVGKQMAAAEIPEQQLENLEFHLGDTVVIDEIGAAQRIESCPELRLVYPFAHGLAVDVFRHRGHRNVQDVQEVTARGAIRTRPQWVCRRQRVQRIQADEARAARRQPADELLQIVEIADPPVRPGTDRVELHRNAPEAPPLTDGGGLVTFGRRQDQGTTRRDAAQQDLQFVVARRQIQRQFQPAAGDPGTLDLTAPKFGAVRGRHHTLVAIAIFPLDGPHQARSELTSGNIEIEPDAGAVRGCHGRQQLVPAGNFELAQLGGERDGIIHGTAHGAQDVGLRLQAEVTQLAAIIVVHLADAAQPSQSIDQSRVHSQHSSNTALCATSG